MGKSPKKSGEFHVGKANSLNAHFPQPPKEHPFQKIFGIEIEPIPYKSELDTTGLSGSRLRLANEFLQGERVLAKATSPAEEEKYPQAARVFSHIRDNINSAMQEAIKEGANFKKTFPEVFDEKAFKTRLSIALLNEVNTRVNSVIFYPDEIETDKLVEVQSAYKTLDSMHGDCEDSAVLKYKLLKDLGFPQDKMAIIGGVMTKDLSEMTPEERHEFLTGINEREGGNYKVKDNLVMWGSHAILMADVEGNRYILDINSRYQLIKEETFNQYYKKLTENDGQFHPYFVWTGNDKNEHSIMSPSLDSKTFAKIVRSYDDDADRKQPSSPAANTQGPNGVQALNIP